jgi:hypothetical protein
MAERAVLSDLESKVETASGEFHCHVENVSCHSPKSTNTIKPTSDSSGMQHWSSREEFTLSCPKIRMVVVVLIPMNLVDGDITRVESWSGHPNPWSSKTEGVISVGSVQMVFSPEFCWSHHRHTSSNLWY